MARPKVVVLCAGLLLAYLGFSTSPVVQRDQSVSAQENKLVDKSDPDILASAPEMLRDGRRTFRHNTFGIEDFRGVQPRLHEAIKGAKFCGMGPGLSPRTALSVELKADVQALPDRLIRDLKPGRVDLDDPAVTFELLKKNAAVGVKGSSDNQGNLNSAGIQCALCHSVAS